MERFRERGPPSAENGGPPSPQPAGQGVPASVDNFSVPLEDIPNKSAFDNLLDPGINSSVTVEALENTLDRGELVSPDLVETAPGLPPQPSYEQHQPASQLVQFLPRRLGRGRGRRNNGRGLFNCIDCGEKFEFQHDLLHKHTHKVWNQVRV